MTLCLLFACVTETDQSREELFLLMKKQLLKVKACTDFGVLRIPRDLRFTTFDDLLRCADELEKEDQVVESVLKRSEQLAREIDPTSTVRIQFQGNIVTIAKYFESFVWDEGRFPKYTPIGDNLKTLLQLVRKLGEDVASKASSYSELNGRRQQLRSNSDSNNVYRDLIYVLTPDVVKDPNDFLETEHLTTVIAYVPAGADADFLSRYMSFAPNIVPLSAKKLVGEFRNFSLYRLIMFKSSVEQFLKECEKNSIVAKRFIYDPEKYRSVMDEQSKLEAEAKRQEALLSRIYRVAYSDLFTCWTHLKAMRVFCEAILRYGVDAKFSCFFLILNDNNQINNIRHILEDFLAPNHNNGNKKASDKRNDNHHDQQDVEDYYPYVSFTFTLCREHH